ncbi:hypothetical protein HA466_0196300 [Hirschfeldia incana]|nr:hypothetical protein HA466_0196300 [Hirschfeldia incana]
MKQDHEEAIAKPANLVQLKCLMILEPQGIVASIETLNVATPIVHVSRRGFELLFLNQVPSCSNILHIHKSVNEIMMESKGGNKKSSSSSSLFYEAPLGYSIEDVRPNGGIKKFKSSVYSNCAKRPS